MKTISDIKNKKSKCNLFADFILNKLDINSSSVVHITDHNNFVVVNGYTDRKEILNLNDITKEFNKNYANLTSPITHTIDLLEYAQEIKPINTLKSIVYLTSENNSYHYSLIEKYKKNPSTYVYDGLRSYELLENTHKPNTSEFPHGYSLNQGRTLYYYIKMIGYNLSREVFGTYLSIELSTSKEKPLEFICIDYHEHDEKLESYVLDMFDFNYEKLDDNIKKMDLSFEVTNPIEDFDFLKEKIELDPFI
jgi:hypothetical protein